MPSLLASSNGLVFSTVLAADATTIDTGANAIPPTGNILDIYALLRTDEVATSSSGGFQFNGDGTSIYDRSSVTGSNTTPGASSAVAASSVGLSPGVAAASDATGVVSAVRITIPGYSSTTFNKAGVAQSGVPDTTAANVKSGITEFQWRSTVAINQLTLFITSGSGQKFKAGSALYVYIR